MKLFIFFLVQIFAEYDDLAKKVMTGFSCDNFKLSFTVTKRQLYKTLNVPKRNRYKVGIGENCVRTLSTVSKSSSGKGSWDEFEDRD